MSYTPNIPVSGQSLGVTKNPINSNFQVLNTTIAVDHVMMNNAGAGQHKQVTFNTVTDPGAGTITPPILFTNNKDGAGNTLPGSLAELFFYTGDTTKSRNQYVTANGTNSGSTMALGGIIIKWGRQANADNTAITFSAVTGSQFPNNCFSVVASPVGTTTSGATQVVVGSISPTAFTPRILDKTGTPIAGQTISWIAIGN